MEIGEMTGDSKSGPQRSGPAKWWQFRQRRLERLRAAGKSPLPLIQRTWVPYFCVTCIVAIWLPERYKVQLLSSFDATHDSVKLWVHKQYWRMTMEPATYMLLLEQLEAGVPSNQRVESTKCPL